MGLDFLPNRTWNIHTHTHRYTRVLCVVCDVLRWAPQERYESLLSTGSRLACWRAERRASWYQAAPPQSVFWPLSGCVHQLKWDGTGQESVSVPLSILSKDAAAATSTQACTKAVLFWIQCQFNRQASCAGGQLWLLRLQLLSLNHIDFIWTSLLNCPPSSPPRSDSLQIDRWLNWCLTKLMNTNLNLYSNLLCAPSIN